MVKQNRWKKTIPYWIAAIVIFACSYLLWGHTAPGNEEENAVELLFLGDSVFGQERGETSVTMLVNERTGLEGINCAIGGTILSRGVREKDIPLEELSLSEANKRLLGMVALTDAAIHKDFGVQQSIYLKENILSYQPAVIEVLDGIDFEQVETLVFNHGINDAHGKVPLENTENPYDEFTFGGALRSVLENLQREYPDLRIIYVTPPFTWYPATMESCETLQYGEYSVEEYVNLALQICAAYNVETVDIYHELYTEHSIEAYELYTEDGLHPNENGRRLIAEAISECLERNR